MDFQRAKGTEDFYPIDESIKQYLFNQFRKVSASFGFQEVSSPAFENFELLSKKEGEEIKEQIFTLEQRGNERLGLRFDLTVPNKNVYAKTKRITKTYQMDYL